MPIADDAPPAGHGGQRFSPAAAARRGLGFFVLWLAMTGPGVADIAIGLPASAAATWCSLRLIPQSPARFSALAALRLLFRFTGQSFLAGLNVARRALDPRLPMTPGFVAYRTRLPAGPARNMFTTIECLLPGALPVEGQPDGTMLLHSLDVHRSVATSMAVDEALLRRAVGGLR